MVDPKPTKKKKYWSRKRGASILTAKRKEALLGALGVGVPVDYACHVAGIDRSTFYRAAQKSREFREAIRRQEAKLMQGLTSMILVAAKNGTWQAAAWMLERRWPGTWAKTEKQEISGPSGAPLPSSRDSYILAVRQALGFRDTEGPPKLRMHPAPSQPGNGTRAEGTTVEAMPISGDGDPGR